MPESSSTSNPSIGLWAVPRDLTSGLVVFLVALPLCLGVALASRAPSLAPEDNVPLFAGLLAGIVGGLVVGIISGSHTSVSGPAAGLTAIVAAQVARLETFDAFLLAVMLAGVLQIVAGLLKGGFVAAFFPTSVIRGLLAAIGVILILKQIPHLFGHDTDPEGDMAFQQPDRENTFSELFEVLEDIHPGASVIGLVSVAVLVFWDRIKVLKKSVFPAPLLVVVLGVALAFWFERLGSYWAIQANHLVQVPVANSLNEFASFLRMPDFSQWSNSAVYVGAVTIAIVASLETLLNLEAVDKIDPKRRSSPSSRELFAQGVGNVTAGLIGGIPVTSVIIRSSVNINTGNHTKLSTIFHGVLLLVCVAFLPGLLNRIPLSCLAAILLITGFKLASPDLVRRMWRGGWNQFVPFLVTVVAIVLSDLLIGILIGLAVAIAYILRSNMKRPLRKYLEPHPSGDLLRIELGNQVSFLNKAVLDRTLDEIPPGSNVLIDARNTSYIDADVLDLLHEYDEQTAPARDINVSLHGFRRKYEFDEKIQFVEHITAELQQRMSSQEALEMLKAGNERFRTGHRLNRNYGRLVSATATGQYPLAVILSCIDSRAPAELILDCGLGDIFSIRIAGNVVSHEVLGSMEYGCAAAGAKLIVVLGHTHCGAVTAAVKARCETAAVSRTTSGDHLAGILTDIEQVVDRAICDEISDRPERDRQLLIDEVARRHVQNSVRRIRELSRVLSRLESEGKIAIVGGVYDVGTGGITFFQDES